METIFRNVQGASHFGKFDFSDVYYQFQQNGLCYSQGAVRQKNTSSQRSTSLEDIFR